MASDEKKNERICKLLTDVGELLGCNTKGQLVKELADMKRFLNDKKSPTTQKLIEYGKKKYPKEALDFLCMMFYAGNCYELYNLFNPNADFRQKYDAIHQLPYYIEDDVDVSLVMVEYDYSFDVGKTSGLKHGNIEFGIFTNTWYDESILTRKFWIDKLQSNLPVTIDKNSIQISHLCLQYNKFFDFLDVFLDKKNIVEVEHPDFIYDKDAPDERVWGVRKVKEFNKNAIKELVMANGHIDVKKKD